MSGQIPETVHDYLSALSGGAFVQTHAARIYFVGDVALKVKRPVHYDYLDFRKLADRHDVLCREFELNKPNAPTLYRDVVPITHEADGHFALNGDGTPVEWVLRMTRFPAENELSAIAGRGALDRALSEALGERIHDLHAGCPVLREDGARLIGDILDEFDREFDVLAAKAPDLRVKPVLKRLRARATILAPLLSERSQNGFVRRCHGDLHLRNIVVLDGEPTPFDALEFDERLGTCDVLYDLAFLLMDLLANDHHAGANVVLNAYTQAEPSLDALGGLAALPFFASVRAVVRGMVAAQKALATGVSAPDFAEARKYIALARDLLNATAPQLIAVGGLSGTGKTTVARALAPEIGKPFGAIHIRSDIERKRLAGVDPLKHLPGSAYTSTASALTYEAVVQRALACLTAGQSVITDAVYGKPHQREAIETLSADRDFPFLGIWLTAGDAERAHRVSAREADASDADVAVVEAQADMDIGTLKWHRISTEAGLDVTLDAMRALMAARTDT